MKKLFSIVLAIVILIFIVSMRQKAVLCVADSEVRPSITFIVGEDKPGNNYFTQAEEYFSWNARDKTDKVVKTCRSLGDIISHLNETAVKDELTWGTVNVVLHGNVWTGLSMDITQGGHRATPKRLVQSVLLKTYPDVFPDAIDSCTQLNFYGCGIGKNPMVVQSLKKMFTNQDGQRPELFISPDYVVFSSAKNASSPVMLRANYWPYIFKRGYQPSLGNIASALRKKYPSKDVDWMAALESEEITEAENTFNQSFHIPVSHTVIYSDSESRPSVSTELEKENWISEQESLLNKISAVGIPQDKFTWTINKIRYTNTDGTIEPAIRAIGMATILCVLEAREY